MSMTAQVKAPHASPQKRGLPNGWRWVTLGKVCKLQTGGTPSKSDPTNFGGDIRWLVSGDIHQGEITDCVGRITTQGMTNSNASLLPPYCVMIALNGQGKTRGTVALLCVEATCNQSLVAMIPRDRNVLLPRFLLHQLQMRYQELRDLTGDSHRSGLSMGILDRLEVILAPIEEQRRIAGVLKEQMAAVEKARTAAQARLEAVKALPAAFLRQVFPQPGQPITDGWRWARLGEVCNRIDYGYTASADIDIKEPKFLRITDIQDGRVDWDSVPGCAILDADEVANRLEGGDIVFVRTGATTGKSYLISNPPRSVFASYLIRVRNHREDVGPDYLFAFFQSDGYWEQISAGARGGAQPGFNATMLAALKIPLPPLAEQRRIAAVLREQMAAVEKARTAAEEELQTMNALPSALLRRVFNGEL